MAKFAAIMRKTTSSTTVGFGSIECPGSGMKRFKLYYVGIGSESNSADNAMIVKVVRTTTANTGTAWTLNPLDPADAAAVTVANTNVTAEGTVTSNKDMLVLPFNQKATVQWYSPPGGEIVVPATANNGLLFQTTTSQNTPSVSATAHIEEQ